MHVDLRPLVLRIARQEVVDGLRGDAAVTDGGRQQMRAHHVAAGEVLGRAACTL